MSIDRQFDLESTIFALTERLRVVTEERDGLARICRADVMESLASIRHRGAGAGIADDDGSSDATPAVGEVWEDTLDQEQVRLEQRCADHWRCTIIRPTSWWAASAGQTVQRMPQTPRWRKAAAADDYHRDERIDNEETDPYHAVAEDEREEPAKLVRDMSTPENRAFWEHVKRSAEETERWPAWKVHRP